MSEVAEPIAMLLWCPECGERHVDAGVFATKPHHTHACQGCGNVWRPAIENTFGVQFLPGFKSDEGVTPRRSKKVTQKSAHISKSIAFCALVAAATVLEVTGNDGDLLWLIALFLFLHIITKD